MSSLLEAKPEPLEIDVERLAVVVIDMQNAFLKKGAMFDVFNAEQPRGMFDVYNAKHDFIDISNIATIIEPIKKITDAARAKKVQVIYTTHAFYSDLRDSGPNSPWWYQEAPRHFRERPELRDKVLARGTWGTAIIDELKPQEGDIVVEHPRFSAFSGTDLDRMLKTHDIKYLVFTGQPLNVCVEATLIDACNHEYFNVLIEDAVTHVPPSFSRDVIIFTIGTCFGWVTNTENLLKAMQ